MATMYPWCAGTGRHAPLHLAALALSGLFAGCATYRSEPLDPAVLANSLEERAVQGGLRIDETQPIELNRQDLERFALLLNPGLRRARLEAGVSQASAEEAGRWADPVIGAEMLRILDPDPGQSSGIFGASLSFTIPLSGRLAVEKSLARREAHAALVGVWVQEQELLKALRLALAEFAHESAAETIRAANHRRLVELVELTDSLHGAGEITTAEHSAFRAAELGSRFALGEQQSRARLALLAIERLAGFPPGVRIAPVGSAESQTSLNDTAEGLEVVATSPPGMLAAAEYEAAEQRLRLAVRSQYPDLEFGPLYGREDRQDRLGLGFSFPIPILNGNKREIAEARALRGVARAAWEEALLTAQAEIVATRSALEQELAQLDLIDDSMIPAAEARLESATTLLSVGEVDALMLLDAISGLEEAQLMRLGAQRAIDVHLAELRYMFPTEPFDLDQSTEIEFK